ncbi:uncharacterized protein VTP21DRAFT_2973 [Calcarisporiella thermophila]|uniref:uncharacterized protein n=1 Tax=Calcarisporiella thermophila TaxID=911321 RepID=UPI0037440BCF
MSKLFYAKPAYERQRKERDFVVVFRLCSGPRKKEEMKGKQEATEGKQMTSPPPLQWEPNLVLNSLLLLGSLRTPALNYRSITCWPFVDCFAET